MPKIQIPLQPKQQEAIALVDKYPVFFYGGSKGGGKSYLARAWQVMRRMKYPNTRGLLIRKTYPELYNNHIQKMFQEWPGFAKYYNQFHKTIKFPNGSSLTFGHLQNPNDVYNYQGQEYDDIVVDEITQHTEETFKILRSSNRTTNPNIKPRMLLTGNPGGVGHAWCKRIFIDRQFLPEEHPEDYGFIQARIYDNFALMDADPQYIENLKQLPEQFRKAYLDGDWNMFAGQYFAEWRDSMHCVDSIYPTPNFRKFITFDYGRTNPFALYWAYVDYDSHIWIYREYYMKGMDARPNAEAVLDLCKDDPINPTTGNKYEAIVAPMDIFSQQGNDMTIAQLIENTGLAPLVPSGGQTKGSRKAKWTLMHEYLRWDEYNAPRLKFYRPLCPNAIRTIPQLIHDERNVEDLNTEGDDHSADAIAQLLVFLHESKTPTPISPVEQKIQEWNQRMGQVKTPLDIYAGR